MEKLKAMHPAEKIYSPEMNEITKEKLFKGWKKAVKQSLSGAG